MVSQGIIAMSCVQLSDVDSMLVVHSNGKYTERPTSAVNATNMQRPVIQYSFARVLKTCCPEVAYSHV